jgi:hypothetical protein
LLCRLLPVLFHECRNCGIPSSPSVRSSSSIGSFTVPCFNSIMRGMGRRPFSMTVRSPTSTHEVASFQIAIARGRAFISARAALENPGLLSERFPLFRYKHTASQDAAVRRRATRR